MKKEDCDCYGIPAAYDCDRCENCDGDEHCYKVFEQYWRVGKTPSGKIMDGFQKYL